jgi:hypothetical protein
LKGAKNAKSRPFDAQEQRQAASGFEKGSTRSACSLGYRRTTSQELHCLRPGDIPPEMPSSFRQPT